MLNYILQEAEIVEVDFEAQREEESKGGNFRRD